MPRASDSSGFRSPTAEQRRLGAGGVAVRIANKTLFEQNNRLSMNDLDQRVGKLERALI
jgi:hypothetical protein